jgi:hypothetical protein
MITAKAHFSPLTYNPEIIIIIIPITSIIFRTGAARSKTNLKHAGHYTLKVVLLCVYV